MSVDALIADELARVVREQGGWLTANAYPVRHLPQHLGSDSDALEALCLDPEYLMRALEVLGAEGLSVTLATAAERTGRHRLKVLDGAVRRARGALKRDPGQLRAQLHARLRGESDLRLRRLLDGFERVDDRVWLRARTATLDWRSSLTATQAVLAPGEHVAVASGGGRVGVIVGGDRHVEIWDPLAGTLVLAPALPVRLDALAAAMIDGRWLIAAACGGEVLLLDGPETGAWRSVLRFGGVRRLCLAKVESLGAPEERGAKAAPRTSLGPVFGIQERQLQTVLVVAGDGRVTALDVETGEMLPPRMLQADALGGSPDAGVVVAKRGHAGITLRGYPSGEPIGSRPVIPARSLPRNPLVAVGSQLGAPERGSTLVGGWLAVVAGVLFGGAFAAAVMTIAGLAHRTTAVARALARLRGEECVVAVADAATGDVKVVSARGRTIDRQELRIPIRALGLGMVGDRWILAVARDTTRGGALVTTREISTMRERAVRPLESGARVLGAGVVDGFLRVAVEDVGLVNPATGEVVDDRPSTDALTRLLGGSGDSPLAPLPSRPSRRTRVTTPAEWPATCIGYGVLDGRLRLVQGGPRGAVLVRDPWSCEVLSDDGPPLPVDLDQGEAGCTGVACGCDLIAVAYERELSVRDADTLTPRPVRGIDADGVTAVSLGSLESGEVLVTGGEQGDVVVWSLEQGRRLAALTLDDPVAGVWLVRGQEVVVATTTDGLTHVFDQRSTVSVSPGDDVTAATSIGRTSPTPLSTR